MTNHSLQLSSSLTFISRLWIREVDQSLLEELGSPEIRAAFEAAGGSVPENTPDTIEKLAIDYCQLLIGPKNQIPPIQSVWAERQYQGKSASSMAQYFAMIPEYQPPPEISDHLGVQLHFAGQLLVAVEGQSDGLAVVKRFADEHLRWSKTMLEQVQSRAETEFYRGLAKLTQELIESISVNVA